MTRRGVFVGVLVALGCGGAHEAGRPEAVQPEAATKVDTKEAVVQNTTETSIEAVIRIDEKPGGKKFQGVWIELAGGERWVVAYRPEGWLRGFEGRAVRVTGATYRPYGQAINATHYRIATLEVSDRQGGTGPWFKVGPELKLTGRFARRTGAPGSKAEGSTWWIFTAEDGAEFEVEGGEVEAFVEGVVMQVVGRRIAPDMSYVARRGGDALWVLSLAEP